MTPFESVNFLSLIHAVSQGAVVKVHKPWGYEYVISVPVVAWTLDGEPQHTTREVKVIRIWNNHRVSLQHHVHGHEVVIILDGDGTVEGTPDDSLGRRRPSKPFPIVPGTKHRSVGPVTLLEFTEAGPDDIIRHEDDYGREGRTGR